MYKKYLLIVLITFVLTNLVQLAFNYTIDPYGLHGDLRQSSFKHQKIHKPYVLMAKQPSAIIIGNSRNLYSFEPKNTSLKNFYNFSFGGIGIQQVNQLFEHAVFASTIQQAIIALDNICDPNSNIMLANSIDRRFLLNENKPKFILSIWKLLLYSSLDTSFLSIENQRTQNRPVAINESGRRLNFDEFYFSQKGYGYALKGREEKKIARQNYSKHNVLTRYSEYKKKCKTSNLDSIIKLAIAHNIQIKFFLNPVNVRYWEIESHSRHGTQYFLYKKKLIQEKILAISENKRDTFWVFDFLKLNQFTKEYLTYRDRDTVPQYWYESSHYKLKLGDLMLNTIINNDFSNTNLVSNLKFVDIEKDFQSQIRIFKNWRETHSATISEIQEVIDMKKGVN